MIIHGDCLEELKKMDSESVDAVVTDPPAGISFMGKEWDTFNQVKTTKSQVITWMTSGVKFDNKTRDSFIDFMTEVMSESLRVLKPGAYAVVWALPRTSHWTATAVENAGFEIRDVIHHIFNSGFPKSHNIGKAVDKREGNEREVVGVGSAGYQVSISKTRKEQGYRPNETNATEEFPLTKGTSPYEGFGTALKPACEHWILARKPLKEKTVAEQVLKTGTGGLDIDGTRIPTMDKLQILHNETDEKDLMGGMKGKNAIGRSIESVDSGLGRFPANVAVQNDALGKENSRYFNLDIWSEKQGILQIPKPAKSEKNKGLRGEEKTTDDGRNKPIDNPFLRGETVRRNSHPTVKSITLMSWLIKLVSKQNDLILDPFAGSGTTLVAAKLLGRNFIGIEKELEYVKIAEARLGSVNTLL